MSRPGSSPAGARLSLRATAFRMDLGDTVANVTLSVEPGLITRQRQNLGTVRSQGIEVDAEARLGRVVLSVGWLRSDAAGALVRRRPHAGGAARAPVAPEPASASLRYAAESGLTASVQGRWAGSQFDDDRNTFPLGTMRTVDAFLAVPVVRVLDVFAAGENLLGGRYEVGRTPVLTLGPPRAVRLGVRLRLAPAGKKSPD